MLSDEKVKNGGQVHIELGNTLKHDAEYVLNQMGLTLTDAVRLFLRQVVKERELPFLVHYSAKIPNKKTLAAMDEIDNGKSQKITTEGLQKLWDNH